MGKPKKTEDLEPSLKHVLLELEMNDFVPEDIGGIPLKAVLREISFALNPEIHEGQMASYGSILSLEDISKDWIDRLVTTKEVSSNVMQEAADGLKNYVVYRGKPEMELCSLHDPIETELGLLKLARACRGLVLKRQESGLLSLVYKEQVFTVQGRRWLKRKPIMEMIRDLRLCVPIADMRIASKIIELCCYVLSPMGIGTTLAWYIKEPSDAESKTWTKSDNLSGLELEVTDEADYPQIVHFSKQKDGAFLIGARRGFASRGRTFKL